MGPGVHMASWKGHELCETSLYNKSGEIRNQDEE